MGREVVPYLPDELLLNCLARVSRWYYPSLFLVSKRFRSLLKSKELYKTRKLLGTTEGCLHLILKSQFEFPPYHYRSLFALCRRPTPPILSSFCLPWKNLLVLVPTDPPTIGRILTAVGSYIYMIGLYNNAQPSTRVFVMNCLSHTWHEAPSMHFPRTYPFVIVINETIYVIERSPSGPCHYVIEYFDTKTHIWDIILIPGGEDIGITGSSAINGNLYLFGDKKNLVYKPKENKWDVVGPEVCLPTVGHSTCMLDNVRYSRRQLQWWDSKVSLWRDLKGCERLPCKFEENGSYAFVRLVNYDGKIAVFWEKNVLYEEKEIWCTEVTLEKCNNGQEICGKVSSHDLLFTGPKSSFFDHFIVSTF